MLISDKIIVQKYHFLRESQGPQMNRLINNDELMGKSEFFMKKDACNIHT